MARRRTEACRRVEWTADTLPRSAPLRSSSLLFAPLRSFFVPRGRFYASSRSSLESRSTLDVREGGGLLPSIRFLVSNPRGNGENLESESPSRLMVNGPETIYPFRSRPVFAHRKRIARCCCCCWCYLSPHGERGSTWFVWSGFPAKNRFDTFGDTLIAISVFRASRTVAGDYL